MVSWYVRVQAKVEGWFESLCRENGAVSIEYVGLATIVAIIIGALLEQATGWGSSLAGGIQAAISKALGPGG